ncbi:oligosaccharide flippase family protein [Listeria fleischmannii]|uniref:oligosaccharide flippase family protein n=1 Tax=Listeria fleischmannii TaxID=1069827 RepID=UPI0016256BE8|nr:polysaccharide biosynthesis C-terminal domain-containing protein [Listeria fleischmannii]MBC1419455.1 oligosaccharide flippase family protein [Listeria fleischmannii]
MKKVTLNYIFVLLYQMTIMITPIFTMPYVLRVLLPNNIGIEAYISSIGQIFIAFTSLGIGDYGRKVIASVTEPKQLGETFFNLYMVQFGFSSAVLLTYLFYAIHASAYQTFLLINSLTILSYVLDITWFYTGQENIKNIMIRNMLVRIFSVLSIFIFVKDQNDLALYMFINAGTLLIGQLVTWLPMGKFISKFKFHPCEAKKHLLPVLTFAVVPIITLVPVSLNKVLLGSFVSKLDVGYYNQAFKLITLFVVFVTALTTVMSPRMVKQYYREKKEDFLLSTYFSFRFTAFTTLPLATGLMVVAPTFIPLFLGEAFTASVLNLQILAPSLFFSGLSGILGIQILVTLGKNRAYSLSILAAALFSLMANVMLMFTYGSMGTSFAYLLFTILACLFQAFFARRFFSPKKAFCQIVPYVIASALACAGEIIISTIFLGKNPFLIILLEVIVGATAYFSYLFLVKDVMLFKGFSLIQKVLKVGN